MPHHEIPSESDCDLCGRTVKPVARHNFHPQTGSVTCDDCRHDELAYTKYRKDWE